MFGCLSAADLAIVVAGELLEAKKKPMPQASPFSLSGWLRAYEYLVGNAADDWRSLGHYLIDEYVNNLDSRDGLTRARDRLEPALGRRVASLVQDLDKELWDATVPDQDRFLLGWTTPVAAAWAAGWWWRRLPRTVPGLESPR